MAWGKRTKRQAYWQIVIVVAVVFVGSLFAVFSSAPDQVFVRSQDGLVTLEAVTRSPDLIEITLHDQTQDSVEELSGPIYQISTGVDTVIESGELEMVIDELWGSSLDLTELAIYYFDRETLAWNTLSTTFDLSENSIQASVKFVGSLLVGVGERVHDE